MISNTASPCSLRTVSPRMRPRRRISSRSGRSLSGTFSMFMRALVIAAAYDHASTEGLRILTPGGRIVRHEIGCRDRVDVGALGCPLTREEASEPGNTAVAGRIGGDSNAALEGEQGNDVDDLAAAAVRDHP